MENPRTLLQQYGLKPRKSLGQNFLIDPSAPARIAEQADLSKDDTVLEVGAGLGVLSAALATCASEVIAVETDPHLMPILEQTLSPFQNVTLVHGDILELDPANLLKVMPEAAVPLWGQLLPSYCVVANLPYYITAAVIRHLLEATVRPSRLILTVQREVAARITATPGDMSVLAVGVQFYAKPRVVLRLKRGAFYPTPKVESAVIRLDSRQKPPVPAPAISSFFRIVRAGFAQRRKQLRNTLSAGLHLERETITAALAEAGVDHTRRAETLSLSEWGAITEALQGLKAK